MGERYCANEPRYRAGDDEIDRFRHTGNARSIWRKNASEQRQGKNFKRDQSREVRAERELGRSIEMEPYDGDQAKGEQCRAGRSGGEH